MPVQKNHKQKTWVRALHLLGNNRVCRKVKGKGKKEVAKWLKLALCPLNSGPHREKCPSAEFRHPLGLV